MIVKERISLKGCKYVGVAVEIDANHELSLKYYWPKKGSNAKDVEYDIKTTNYRLL